MKTIIVLVLISAVVYGQPPDDKDWKEYKAKYGKAYGNTAEEGNRKRIFKENKQKISNHNARYQRGEESYEMGENEFSDLDHQEFLRTHANLNVNQAKNDAPATTVGVTPSVGAPVSWDWRTYGAVTPIKDQSSCGSCWAFSAVGAIESCRKIYKGLWEFLSEQQLVDCSSSYGNSGCNGGWMNNAFNYVKAKGLQTSASYTYNGVTRTCQYVATSVVARITGYVNVAATETALVDAVWKQPVSVAIDASGFQFYKSGVFNYPNCTTAVNHGVLAIGYGSAGVGSDFWIVKNSWGTGWGEGGFIRMSRNKNNQCAIASYASYPTGCT